MAITPYTPPLLPAAELQRNDYTQLWPTAEGSFTGLSFSSISCLHWVCGPLCCRGCRVSWSGPGLVSRYRHAASVPFLLMVLASGSSLLLIARPVLTPVSFLYPFANRTASYAGVPAGPIHAASNPGLTLPEPGTAPHPAWWIVLAVCQDLH